jgi:hypothetical protein
MFYTIQTQSSLALSLLGVHDPARLGLLTAIASLGVPLGTLIFRGLARLPIGVLLCLEFVVSGVGFVWMGKAADPAVFVLAAAVNQIGCGMLLPTLLTWATRGLAFELRGRGNGAWQSTFAVGQFVSGVLVTAPERPRSPSPANGSLARIPADGSQNSCHSASPAAASEGLGASAAATAACGLACALTAWGRLTLRRSNFATTAEAGETPARETGSSDTW